MLENDFGSLNVSLVD